MLEAIPNCLIDVTFWLKSQNTAGIHDAACLFNKIDNPWWALNEKQQQLAWLSQVYISFTTFCHAIHINKTMFMTNQ